MADSQQLATDGTVKFLGGQDASKIPSLVPPDSYFSGVNLSIARGVPCPQWGVDKKTLKFPDTFFDVGNNVMVSYKNIFHYGRYQACIPYSIGPDDYNLIIVSGLMYLVNIKTYEVSIISLPDKDGQADTLNENTSRINWSNASKYLVLFDAPNRPVILEGITAHRSDPQRYEVPVSVLGAYNQNRLFISNLGNEFTAGDPTGNTAAPEPPVSFREVLETGADFFGQIFQLPTDVLKDPITAMAFLQFTDTSTGIGPLLIATHNTIVSYNSQNPRESWAAGNFGTTLVFDAGIAGPRSFINVNSDLFFMSADGQIRSLSMSRDEQKKWARVPISREVENWLILNDKELVQYAVLGYFQNKIFITCNPYRVDAYSRNGTPIFDVAHGGFVVIELDNLATLGKDGQPAWPGLFIPCRPMDIVNNAQRCFIMSKDGGSNELYEMMPKQTYDTYGSLVREKTSILYTKEYDYQNPFQLKSVHSMDIDLQNVAGDFSMHILYKPSQGAQYVDWRTFTNQAPWRQCGNPGLFTPDKLAGHTYRDLTIGAPVQNSACDPVGATAYNTFRKQQIKFILKGIYWELVGYRLKATPLPQSEQLTKCDKYTDVAVPTQCNNDWALEPFESCSSQQTL